MDKLVFATNNPHKLEEVRAILGSDVEVLSLRDIGCAADIPETADTLEGNALLKARFVASRYGVDCFADDTGLEVAALDGAPGVYSARFAGPGAPRRTMCASCSASCRRPTTARHVSAPWSPSSAGARNIASKAWWAAPSPARPPDAEASATTPCSCPKATTAPSPSCPRRKKNRISHRARAVAKLADFLRGARGER